MKINNLEIKVATYCTLALLAGLIIVSCLGCATTTESKVHVGEKTYSAATGIGVRMENNSQE